jgi:TonB family protein
MKKYLIICALGLSFVLVQGCGTDNKKTEITTPMTIADRHAKVEQERDRLAEQRRTELAELIAASNSYENANGRIVYYKADIDPSYVGGEKAMNKFLKENLKFPEVAEQEAMEGTVFVEFIVAQNGDVTEVVTSNNTYKEVDNLFREEALRVVNLMPNWTPGQQNGAPVDVKFSIPITFLIR